MADIMTAQEVAKYLRFHVVTIQKLANEGKIPAIRVGKSWRFDKETINEWVKKSGK